MMRVLVLGATGFIGGQIARAAAVVGLEVHALRRNPVAVGAISDLQISWHTGDLAEVSSLQAAMQGCEVIFHAAGYAPLADRSIARALRQGVQEMRSVLDAAQASGVGRVVYTSSLTTIGPPQSKNRLADERDAYLPGSTGNNYFEVKWAMENEALRSTAAGLPVVTLIPTAVFGPGDVKPSTSQILLLLAQGRIPVGIDIATNIVDGRDVALAHIRAIERGEPGQRYLIGGHNLNVADALRRAASVIGVRGPGLTLSVRTVTRLLKLADLLRLPIPATMRGIPHWQPLNPEKGWQTFGFVPRPFDDTVRDTVAWFREHGYL